ncbi:hypothetical protein CHUAL_000627 [Chamberlinius hualienensis]
MDDSRVVDYFVVTGLPENDQKPCEDYSPDGSAPKASHGLPPITDIHVLFPSLGEEPPTGYKMIETTPTGYAANLNHGSLRSLNVFLCYRRGTDKPPIVDIGVYYVGGKERLMSDMTVIEHTPYGRSANVNNGGSQTFIIYRRAKETDPCNSLVVTDMCVILLNKGESPPHTYCMITKNLNKGMLTSDVYLCYKKSVNVPNALAFQPGLLGRFPLKDYESFPLPDSVPLFCLPMGANIECWPVTAKSPDPVYSSFVLTVSDAVEKVYGASVSFYEIYPEEHLSEEQKSHLGLINRLEGNAKTVNVSKCICILSHWPFFDTFHAFLKQLYEMSRSGSHPIPIERYISHFAEEVPFPSLQRPRILIEVSAAQKIYLSQPVDSPLPLSGASFIGLLKSLQPDDCLMILLLALMEQKILVHSLRPDTVTRVTEAISMFIFPFRWQCPYIPLCPLGLSDVLSAPMPFIVGFDSRYFDLYDPPTDVYCVDLDTSTISNADKKWSIKMFPKKPARTLRNSLQRLVEKIRDLESSLGDANIDIITDDASIDKVFKRKKQKNMIETEIQEAFLRFMATILKGFRSWLLPIMRAPTIGCTDPSSLFDIHGFLKSRDKAYHRFYTCLMKTQMFTRLLEERSFVTDKDASLVFFDECTEKVENGDSREVRLIECDQQSSERTVVIPLPDTTGLPPGVTYSYTQFGPLNPLLFHHRRNKHLLSVSSRASPAPNSPMARRTKQEIKSAQKLAQMQSKDPRDWIKCLNSYSFCLWFIHLPAYVKETPNKCKALNYAFEVLRRMEYIGLHPVDEVCYRVLMQLCGQSGEPVLAVKLLSHMKDKGVQPNAITYGYYNKAVLESKWPSQNKQNYVLWRKLRTVIFGVSQFRRSVKLRPPSIYSESDSASTESTGKTEEGDSKGPQSDGGYCSLNLDDTQKSSSSINSSQVPSDCTDSSDKVDKNSVIKDESANGGFLIKNRIKDQDDNKKYSRLNKYENVDFSEANDFRNRRGSIIKVFPYASMNGARGTESVNSAAGLLIVGQSMYDDVFVDGDHNFITPSPKIHDLQWNSENHCETSCSSPSRHNSGSNQRSLIGYSPSNSSECESNSELLRSGSYGSDARILSHLSKGSTDHLDSSVFSEVDSGHLKLSDTSLNNYESDDGPFVSSHPGQRSPNISIKQNLRRTSNLGSIPSPQLTPVTQNDPLGVFTSSPLTTVAQSSVINNKFSVINRRIEELIPSQPFRNEPKRRSVNLGRGGDGKLMVYGTGGKVPRSSTFENSSPFSSLMANSNSSVTRSSSLPRSNTIADTAILTDHKTNGILGANTMSPLWSSLTARIQSTLSPARKSESLFESLKTTMSSKLTEIKEAITTTNFATIPNTPSKPHLSKQFDSENEVANENECRNSQSSQESEPKGNSCRYPREDSISDYRYNIERSRLRSSVQGSVTSQDLDNLFTAENSRHFGSLKTRRVNSSTALEIRITSCSKCHVCQGLLYDEDIMALWTPEESNLNTRCPFCNSKVVPVLTVTIMDYRSETSGLGVLSPAQSVESVRSFQSRKPSMNAELQNETIFYLERSPEKESLKNVESPSMTFASSNNQSSNVLDTTDMTDASEPNASSLEQHASLSEQKGSSYEPNVLPSSVSSSLVDIYDDLSRKESSFVPVASLDPIVLPYLSPIVLRKELESVLDDEGDGCLTRSEFVDRHPIIYWNLIWYCRRLNLPSNLPGLCLKSKAVNKDRIIPLNWMKSNSRNVIVRCMWDCPKLHEEHGPPMYLAWHQEGGQSTLYQSLVTEPGTVNKGTMQQIISGIECDDIASPLKILIGELRKRSASSRGRHFSVYRDLLFLCISIIGRENVDLLAFDREYRSAFRQLTPGQRHVLQRYDYPPGDSAILCRQRFGSLEL